jgi:tRNA nucleotidyltransferase (CCA-adding enzyme)
MVRYWQVGGFVRDRLLGVASKDVDYAVEAPSYDAMLADIKLRGGTVFLESPQYSTVRAKLPGGLAADFVLCRKDGQYSDGRRPDSVEPGTLYDDLARRDFTVNAIAYDETTGEYVDPFHGRAYLEQNLLVCVGNARDRFNEDALRLLRALRFHVTKGFNFGDDILGCLTHPDLAQRLKETVSVERKREELTRCFAHDTPKTLALLARYPRVSEACFSDGNLWLLPTQQKT